MERWAPIPEWPLYEISDHGNVRSWVPHPKSSDERRGHPVPRKTVVGQRGYTTLTLVERKWSRAKTFAVHRLVATVFVDGDKSLHVAHLDGNKTNNHYTNLRWVTRKENEAHKILHGRKQEGALHVSAKLCDSAVNAVLRLVDAGIAYSDIADLFEISTGTVCDYVKGRSRFNLTKRSGA